MLNSNPNILIIILTVSLIGTLPYLLGWWVNKQSLKYKNQKTSNKRFRASKIAYLISSGALLIALSIITFGIINIQNIYFFSIIGLFVGAFPFAGIICLIKSNVTITKDDITYKTIGHLEKISRRNIISAKANYRGFIEIKTNKSEKLLILIIFKGSSMLIALAKNN